jgi:3-deoxy-D-manno-octulosonate 8-phosphate phosphatase (KDO 8-P phosphatase)
MIKAVLLDVDGVLTDGKKYYFEGKIAKSFSVKDGQGIKDAQEKGIIFGIITSDNWEEVKERANHLGIEDVYIGTKDKVEAAKDFCLKYNLELSSEVCFMGDDVNDIPILREVCLAACVKDAVPSVHALCTSKKGYICSTVGGSGAVRELLHFITKN